MGQVCDKGAMGAQCLGMNLMCQLESTAAHSSLQPLSLKSSKRGVVYHPKERTGGKGGGGGVPGARQLSEEGDDSEQMYSARSFSPTAQGDLGYNFKQDQAGNIVDRQLRKSTKVYRRKHESQDLGNGIPQRFLTRKSNNNGGQVIFTKPTFEGSKGNMRVTVNNNIEFPTIGDAVGIGLSNNQIGERSQQLHLLTQQQLHVDRQSNRDSHKGGQSSKNHQSNHGNSGRKGDSSRAFMVNFNLGDSLLLDQEVEEYKTPHLGIQDRFPSIGRLKQSSQVAPGESRNNTRGNSPLSRNAATSDVNYRRLLDDQPVHVEPLHHQMTPNAGSGGNHQYLLGFGNHNKIFAAPMADDAIEASAAFGGSNENLEKKTPPRAESALVMAGSQPKLPHNLGSVERMGGGHMVAGHVVVVGRHGHRRYQSSNKSMMKKVKSESVISAVHPSRKKFQQEALQLITEENDEPDKNELNFEALAVSNKQKGANSRGDGQHVLVKKRTKRRNRGAGGHRQSQYGQSMGNVGPTPDRGPQSPTKRNKMLVPHAKKSSQGFNRSRTKSPRPGNNGRNTPRRQSKLDQSNDDRGDQSFGTSQESSDNQDAPTQEKPKEFSKNMQTAEKPKMQPPQQQLMPQVGRSGGKTSLTRVKASLTQKAVEIAEKSKNNVINYWNLFVVDSTRPYTESYKMIKKIGQGGCGEVFMVMHLATDQIRAMKVVSKHSDKVVKSVFDELYILKQLDHPNIVKVFEFFQDDKNLYVIMEYLKGGSIFERMKITGRFGERESAYIIKQILQALNYLVEKRIVHRDLKLENILFSQEEQLHVKIVDFGSAISLDQYNPKTTNRIITSYYVAPEVAMKEENIQKCDVWSAGVILFILLSGSLPFKGNTDNEVIEKVCKGFFNFDDPSWKNVSSKGKFLIRDMLDINTKNRATFLQCIESPWIKMLTKIDASFRIDARRLSKAFDHMTEFRPVCKLRILVLHFSLGYFNFDSHIEKISKIYSYMDIRHCACITDKDLFRVAKRIYKDQEPAALQEKQQQLAAKLDLRKEGGIAYSDFLIACLDFSKMLTSQKLTKLFSLIDRDNDGFISIKDLHAFSSKELPLDHCHAILRECYVLLQAQAAPDQAAQPQEPDIPSDQLRLSFSQFKNIVLNHGLTRKDPDPNDPKPKTTNTQPLAMNFAGPADLAQSYKLGRDERNLYPKISVDYFSPNGIRPGPNISQESIQQPIVIVANSSFIDKQQKSHILKNAGGQNTQGIGRTTDDSKEDTDGQDKALPQPALQQQNQQQQPTQYQQTPGSQNTQQQQSSQPQSQQTQPTTDKGIKKIDSQANMMMNGAAAAQKDRRRTVTKKVPQNKQSMGGSQIKKVVGQMGTQGTAGQGSQGGQQM